MGCGCGEDARETARREICDELEPDLQVGWLLCVNWSPENPVLEVPMGEVFVFDAGVIPPAGLEAKVHFRESELDECQLFHWSEASLHSRWGAH